MTALILSCLSSCGGDDFYGHAELRLPLGEEFFEVSEEGFDKVYTDGNDIVALTRISFDAGNKNGIPETMTPYELCELWLYRTGRSSEIEISENGVIYTIYYEGFGEDEVFYLEAFYRTPYAYFVILCASPISTRDESREEFFRIIDNAYIIN